MCSIAINNQVRLEAFQENNKAWLKNNAERRKADRRNQIISVKEDRRLFNKKHLARRLTDALIEEGKPEQAADIQKILNM